MFLKKKIIKWNLRSAFFFFWEWIKSHLVWTTCHTPLSDNQAKGGKATETQGSQARPRTSRLCDLGTPLWASMSSFVRQGWWQTAQSSAKILSVKDLSQLPALQAGKLPDERGYPYGQHPLHKIGFRTEAVREGHTMRRLIPSSLKQTLRKVSPQRGGSWTRCSRSCARTLRDVQNKTGVFCSM